MRGIRNVLFAGDEVVAVSLLVEFYRRLPARNGQDADSWQARYHAALSAFRKQIAQIYTEGTLLRLLECDHVETRRAAVLALGLLGTLAANRPLADCLHDGDDEVRETAVGSLWAVWFRGDSEDNAQELQRLVRLKDRTRAMAGLDALIERASSFAEAYNQRAILHYQRKQFEKSIADCERTLALNPYHFGAQVGLAQCLLQMGRQRAALKAFRYTLRLHPTMAGVAETIRALEEALDDGGGRD